MIKYDFEIKLNDIFLNNNTIKNNLIVYVINNIITNKKYVGSTSAGLYKRFKNHKQNIYRNNPKYLYNSIRKYGIESFLVYGIFCNNITQMNRIEEFLIYYYDSFNNGYNLTSNGQSIINLTHYERSNNAKILWTNDSYRNKILPILNSPDNLLKKSIQFSQMNKDKSIIIKQQLSKANKIINKIIEDNLEFNKDNYETYRSNTNAMKYDKLIKYL